MAFDLGIQTKLDLPFEQAIQKTTEALKVEGFGVLTKIDVQATFKEKINADFRRYVILGACNTGTGPGISSVSTIVKVTATSVADPN